MSSIPGPEPSTPPGAYTGRAVTLRAVSRADYPLFLHWRTDLGEMHLSASSRYIPTVEEYYAELEHRLKQSIVLLALSAVDHRPIGFVEAFNINTVDSWCFILFYFVPEYRSDVAAREAAVVFINHLLFSMGLRKVYLELSEDGRQSLGSILDSALVEEAIFREHVWYDGRYVDISRFAIYRETWPETWSKAQLLLQVAQESQSMADGQSAADGQAELQQQPG